MMMPSDATTKPTSVAHFLGRDDYDDLVIGSGIGGAVAVCR
jgi:hypothetical protein